VTGSESLDVFVEPGVTGEALVGCAEPGVSELLVFGFTPDGTIGATVLVVVAGGMLGEADVVAAGVVAVGEEGATSTSDGEVVVAGAGEVVVISVFGPVAPLFEHAPVMTENAASEANAVRRTARSSLATGVGRPQHDEI
jgi:hypothetical protein